MQFPLLTWSATLLSIMEHRQRPQKSEQRIAAMHIDPEVLDLFARRLRAGLFAARTGDDFQEILEQPFVSVIERELFINLARELLESAERCLTGELVQ